MELSSPAQCLLCLDNCTPQNEEVSGRFTLLGRELKVVFVLRELLRLPPEKLEGFLGRSGGDHPHQWIRFCDPCQLLVEGAFTLFEQKVRIIRKLKKVQEQVILKVRESQGKADGGRDSILLETRDFVGKHEYGAFENPFQAGDWEAEWRMGTQEAVQVRAEDVLVKLEQEDSDYCDNYDDMSSDFCDHGDGKVGNINSTKKRPGKRKAAGESKARPKQKIEEGEVFTDANGKSMYRCLHPNCSKEYDSRRTFFQHKSLHRDNPDYIARGVDTWLTCNLCSETFVGSAGLQVHKAKKHPETVEQPFACAECPLRFGSSNGRRQHVMKVHRNLAPKKKKPGTGSKVKAHLRQCPHCPYNTKSNAELEVHVKGVHEGQRALHCELCGKGVSCQKMLRLHQALQHSICGVKGCALQLESREHLHGHQISVHGKEADVFQCPQCAEYLVGRYALDRHEKLRHPPGEGGGGGGQHICEQCGKAFAIRQYLRYHVKYTHDKAQRRKN